MRLKIAGLLFFVVIFLSFSCLSFAQTYNQSYCSIFTQPEKYNAQIITTRALMSYSTAVRVDGVDSFLYSQKCNNKDYFAVIEFLTSKQSDKWSNFFEKLPENKNLILEIEFVGRLKTSIIPVFGHLSWSRNQMEILEIKSIKNLSSVAKNKLPDEKSDAPLTKRRRHLQNVSWQITLDFLNRDYDSLNKYISKDFKVIGISGETTVKENLPKLSRESLFGNFESNTLAVRVKNATRKDKYFFVDGELEFIFSNEKSQKLKFEITFLIVKENLSANEMKIIKFQ